MMGVGWTTLEAENPRQQSVHSEACCGIACRGFCLVPKHQINTMVSIRYLYTASPHTWVLGDSPSVLPCNRTRAHPALHLNQESSSGGPHPATFCPFLSLALLLTPTLPQTPGTEWAAKADKALLDTQTVGVQHWVSWCDSAQEELRPHKAYQLNFHDTEPQFFCFRSCNSANYLCHK